MKFSRKPETKYLYSEIIITLFVDRNSIANDIMLDDIDLDAEYEFEVKKRRNKRSLDANAYSWVLISKLAQKLNKKPIDIYREIIRDMSTYEIVPIRQDAVNHWITTWETRGLGWICIDMGPTKNFPEYNYIKCHYGSSVFNTKEMSQFIDLIIEECKEQGIEYLTPDELQRLKSTW